MTITDVVQVSMTVQNVISDCNVAITQTVSGGYTYTWDVDEMAQGEGGMISITGTLSESLYEHGDHTFANRAEITKTITDDESGNDSDEADVKVTDADLKISKEASDLTPAPDWNVVYTLTVTNDGPDDATSVVGSDTLPVSVTYQSHSGDGSYEDTSGTWDVGNLNDDDSATLHIVVEVVTGTEDLIITNTAAVSESLLTDLSPANDAVTANITPWGGGTLTHTDWELTTTVEMIFDHQNR